MSDLRKSIGAGFVCGAIHFAIPGYSVREVFAGLAAYVAVLILFPTKDSDNAR